MALGAEATTEEDNEHLYGYEATPLTTEDHKSFQNFAFAYQDT